MFYVNEEGQLRLIPTEIMKKIVPAIEFILLVCLLICMA